MTGLFLFVVGNQEEERDTICFVANQIIPTPVSYTHLDVYKRQLMEKDYEYICQVQVSEKLLACNQVMLHFEGLDTCLLYTSRCV